VRGVKHPAFVGFGMVAAAELAFVATRVSRPEVIALPILAPLLAVWAWQMGGPKVLSLALVFFGVGDLLGNPRRLGIEHGGLVFSMAAFAIAYACLITVFLRLGSLNALRVARGRQRWRAVLAVVYVVGTMAAIWAAWNGLEPVIRVAGLIYALLLVGTAATAIALDTRAGIGAALLLGSNLLIALAVAGRVDAAATSHRLEVLVLYLLGIALVAVGVVNIQPQIQRPRQVARVRTVD
jgi:hypothetical protein